MNLLEQWFSKCQHPLGTWEWHPTVIPRTFGIRTLGVGPRNLHFNKPCKWFWCKWSYRTTVLHWSCFILYHIYTHIYTYSYIYILLLPSTFLPFQLCVRDFLSITLHAFYCVFHSSPQTPGFHFCALFAMNGFPSYFKLFVLVLWLLFIFISLSEY